MAKTDSGQADYEQIISHLQIIRTWAEVDWECGYVSIINPKCCEDIVKWIDEALELLKEQNDIVKCKTCKYWDDTSEGRYIGGWCFCDRLKFSTSPEWYCADGEGKTDADD